MFRRMLPLFFVVLVVASVMLACGESSNNTGSTTNTGPAPTSAPAQHFKVGQVVKVGDTWQVTVNSVKANPGTDIDKPQKSGDTFLIVNVSLKNISNTEQNVSSLIMFSLSDASGQKITETITTFAKASPDGKVAAGSPLTGELAYEVPTSGKAYTLAFEADITSSGQTIWDLKL